MSFDSVLSRFADQAPVATMVRAAMANILSPRELDKIFEESRQRQYEDRLLFSSVVGLLTLAVTKTQPSLHAAYQSQREELGVSVAALYDKLSGVELTVTRELVRRTAQRMSAVIDALGETRRPVLQGYSTLYLDGSHLGATEHRLKPTRSVRGGPLPGLGLVVLDGDRRIISDFLPCVDGQAQERSLMLDWIDLLAEDQLWIADRNFCTKQMIFECHRNKASFLLRHHGGLACRAEGPECEIARCATGTVQEQTVSVEGDTLGAVTLRRITIKLDKPTTDGTQEICLLTNLPTEVSASKCADLYHTRWDIEAAFGEIASSLRGEIDTLCYPAAALLGYAIGLVTYNLLAVAQAAMSVVHGRQMVEENVSSYHMANEVATTWTGLEIAIPDSQWQARFAKLDAAQLAHKLLALAHKTQLRRYQKHRRGPKKPTPKRQGTQPHVSTARLLAQQN
ncbi:MAG: transposase [Pirellulaceae bacterium]|nr:transposase [Pirellulaceae bacterium]